MLRNYLLVAFRNLKKNKIFSIINISGLALGMTSCILITLWVKDEYSVDGFHKNSSQLFSVYEKQYNDNKVDAFHSTPGLLANEMKKSFPEVEFASGFGWIKTHQFEYGEKTLTQTGSWAGNDFFSMFSYKLVKGDANAALNSPSAIAVSRNMAESFFGSIDNAFQQTIRFDDKKDFTITAIFEDPGPHSSVRFDYLINWETFVDENSWLKDWNIHINDGPRTYIALKAGTNVQAFESKIRDFLGQYYKDQRSGFHIELGIQRFDQMYLHQRFEEGKPAGGKIEYVRLFSIVAIFILFIACINFINLTTARFVKRAKEIGVRKVVGALRFSLIKQFIGESVFISLLALLLAFCVVLLLLPSFNLLIHKSISVPSAGIFFWAGIAACTVLTGVLSGIYPSLFLSSFDPIKVLKGVAKSGHRTVLLRKGLVVFQFVLSIALITGTIVISQQISFIQTKNLGYNRENVISIPMQGNMLSQYNAFKQEAAGLPGVKSMSRITQIPSKLTSGTSDLSWQNKNPDDKSMFIWASVGYDFVKTLNLNLSSGRDFSMAHPADSTGFILNESAVRLMGFQDPVGKKITFWGKEGTIVGVLKDFHFNSLHDPIRPLILKLNENDSYGTALVKIEGAGTPAVLQSLGRLSQSINPKFPFEFQFLDEAYTNLYASEQMVGSLAAYFAVLAISICCLGLLGLVIFSAEQRTKEIGIRKVLGASTISVFSLLSADFLKLVLIAFFIAAPLAGWAMYSWLEGFAYHINISWWMFVLSGVLALLIALMTISLQAVKSAMANPVTSLRSE